MKKYLLAFLLILAISTNGFAALNWQELDTSKMDEAKEIMEQLIKDVLTYQNGKVTCGSSEELLADYPDLKLSIESKMNEKAIRLNTLINQIKSELTQ